jgi:ADP-heptose:LPS heptosyltransferase
VTEGHSRERILLVRLSAMGDVLQALPALAALRAARPAAEIGWAVERRFADVLVGHAAIDRLFVWERRKGGGLLRNVAALARLRRELRAWSPGIAVDLQGNLRGALVTRLSGAPRRISLSSRETQEHADWAASETVPPSEDAREHRGRRAFRLVAPLLDSAPAPTPASVLAPVPEEARDRVRAALAERGLAERPFALFIAGTSDFGAFKRWPPERFGRLAQRLVAERDLPVLVSWGPGQRHLAGAIEEASQGAAHPAPATSSLSELQALLESAALVVGADSGPVVMAGAAGRPTVALFGPKDPAVYAPPGPRTAVAWKGVFCSPCTLRRCDDPICMTQLTADEVWPAVTAVLDGSRETAEVRS